MTDEELGKRLKGFQQRLDYAQSQVGVPSLVVYAFMASGDGKEPASVIGGETMCMPGRMDERTVETSFGEMITLMGYVWGRLEVLKQEQSAQYGPKFSVVLQREVQGNVRQGSAMEQFGFQSSLTDLVRGYEPAIAIGSTVGSVVDGRATPGEPSAYMATATRSVGDLIPAFAAIKRGYDDLVEHTAKHAGIDLAKFRAMIDEGHG
ncbi:MAG: hypothetical protein ACKVU4_00980 [Phycisphaerales bacterium]